ncbi:hypothetical protein M947_10660 [Sulfurimonas hongkongensis]|uniref:Campylobacter invasion antigen D C-terminal domain-containing protein n=1 Tax=Sulfurimonas hongkongensis TaxID=1172190 RepID=T0KCK8_9BACT|nr:hypothetical protein [Sulfurimonas hongkongensis]EQB34459.1 hypothetical protein M947_10660 [Sulfurimonas hongkongensis]
MELKDVILSTLAEMEDNETTKKVLNSSIEVKKVQSKDELKKQTLSSSPIIKEKKESEQEIQKTFKEIENSDDSVSMESEESFLNSLRERMLVLFEGFQAPNNTGIDAKVDMTLNFLEYVLANIDLRKEEIKKGKQR